MKFASACAKKYHQFCNMHGLRQPIQFLTGITFSKFLQRDSQKGVINIGLSDHHLVFCTTKFSKFKRTGVHKYINFHSLKHHRANDHTKCLRLIVFPSYGILDDVNAEHSDFFQKILIVIEKFPLIRLDE